MMHKAIPLAQADLHKQLLLLLTLAIPTAAQLSTLSKCGVGGMACETVAGVFPATPPVRLPKAALPVRRLT